MGNCQDPERPGAGDGGAEPPTDWKVVAFRLMAFGRAADFCSEGTERSIKELTERSTGRLAINYPDVF